MRSMNLKAYELENKSFSYFYLYENSFQINDSFEHHNSGWNKTTWDYFDRAPLGMITRNIC